MTDDFFSVAHRQRAHRAFSDETVTDEEIERLLDAAVQAPSAENKQPWEFVVVRDARLRDGIGTLMLRAWELGGAEDARARLDAQTFAKVEAGMRGGVTAAPVVIVVCADVERGRKETVGSSVFPAVQNLLLAATALGLGSALTTIATYFRTEMASLLGLPEHVWAVAVVPIGRPARSLGPPRRDPVATHTHRDRFGKAW